MEGRDKIIQLGGIVRNTSNSTSQDGEFEEIVNLRYKDGRFVTMNQQKDVEGLENVRVPYRYVYVHSNHYQHFIGYDKGAVWYFADMDDDGVVTMFKDPVRLFDVNEGDNGIQFTQTGNIVSLLGDDKIDYLYWRDGRYVVVDANFNGHDYDNEVPIEGLIAFRQAHKRHANGSKIVRVIVADAENRGGDGQAEMIETMMRQSRDLSIRKGEPTGYYYVCSALKLYDGNYILQSRPVLMRSEPDALNRTHFDGEKFGLDDTYSFRTFCDFKGNEKAKDSVSINNNLATKVEDSTNGDMVYYECASRGWSKSSLPCDEYIDDYFLIRDNKAPLYQENGRIDTAGEYTCGLGVEEIPDLFVVGRRHPYGWASVGYQKEGWGTYYDGPSTLSAAFDPNFVLNDASVSGTMFDNNHWLYRPVVITTPRELQVMFKRQIPIEWQDIVESVCIFMTPQQDMMRIMEDEFVGTMRNKRIEINTTMYQKPEYRDAFYLPNPPGGIDDWNRLLKRLDDSRNFYKIAEFRNNDISINKWISIDMEKDSILKNLVQQERLNLDASDRNSYLPKTMLMYNGRQHIANYTTKFFSGFPLGYFLSTETRVDVSSSQPKPGNYMDGDYMSAFMNGDGTIADASSMWKEKHIPYRAVVYTLQTNNGSIKVARYQYPEDKSLNIPRYLNPMLSYPDTRCVAMEIHLQYVCKNGSQYKFYHRHKKFDMSVHPSFGVAYYLNPAASLIDATEWSKDEIILQPGTIDDQVYYDWENTFKVDDEEFSNTEYRVNGIKVSSVDNPFYMPAANTYKVGNQQIIALATNSVMVSEGQVGDMPLYVFCGDGVYGLFVDSSGQVVYRSSRPISRDVCLSWRSVCYTDEGVSFITDRGLKLISGSNVSDISDPIEGKYYDFTNQESSDFNAVMLSALSNDRLVRLADFMTKESIAEYLSKCSVGYNHRDRELWVSNPDKPYSYVLSHERWYKRSVTCDEFINNYPETYMLRNGRMTYLGIETQSGNEVMALTRSLKFDTQQFKQAYRSVLRSHLKTHGVYDLILQTIHAQNMNFDPVVKTIDAAEYPRQTLIAEYNTTPPRHIVVDREVAENIIICEDAPQEETFTADPTVPVVAYEKLLEINMLEKKPLAFNDTHSGTAILPLVRAQVQEITLAPTVIDVTTESVTTLADVGGLDATVNVNFQLYTTNSGNKVQLMATVSLNADPLSVVNPSDYRLRIVIPNVGYNFGGYYRDDDLVMHSFSFIQTNGEKGIADSAVDKPWNTESDVPTGRYLEIELGYSGGYWSSLPVEVDSIDTGRPVAVVVTSVSDGASWSYNLDLSDKSASYKALVLEEREIGCEVMRALTSGNYYGFKLYHYILRQLGESVEQTQYTAQPHNTGYFGARELENPDLATLFDPGIAEIITPNTYLFEKDRQYRVRWNGSSIKKMFIYIADSGYQYISYIKAMLDGYAPTDGVVVFVDNSSRGEQVVVGTPECYLEVTDPNTGTTERIVYSGPSIIDYQTLRENIDNNVYPVWTTPLMYTLTNGDVIHAKWDDGGYALKYVGVGEDVSVDYITELFKTRPSELPAIFEPAYFHASTLVRLALDTDHPVGVSTVQQNGGAPTTLNKVAYNIDVSVNFMLEEVLEDYDTSNYRYGVEPENGVFVPVKLPLNEGNYNIKIYDYLGSLDAEYHAVIPVGEYQVYDIIDKLVGGSKVIKQYSADTYIVSVGTPLLDETTEPLAADGYVRVIVPFDNITHNIYYVLQQDFTLAKFAGDIANGFYDDADIVSPGAVTLNGNNLKITDDNGNVFLVFRYDPSEVTMSYYDIIDKIRSGEFMEYSLLTDNIELKYGHNYHIILRTTALEVDDTKHYEGADIVMTGTEFVQYYQDNENLFAAKLLGYTPESVYIDDGEFVSIYDRSEQQTYSIVFSGGTAPTTAVLIDNCKNGMYTKRPVTLWQDDLAQLNANTNVDFYDLNGTLHQFFNDVAKSVPYSQLLAEADSLDAQRSILGNIYYLVPESNYLLAFTDEDGVQTQYEFVYPQDGEIRLTLEQLLALAPTLPSVPDVDTKTTIRLETNKIIDFYNLDNKEDVFVVESGNTASIVVRYADLNDELALGNESGVITDVVGISYPYHRETISESQECKAGIYVFGSYDLRRWQFLGGNEIGGEFRDLGCKAERVDCKYFRILFVGNISYDSEVDYLEMSVEDRLLANKIR